MTLTVSTKYTRANNQAARTPIYKVAFTGVSQTFSTAKVGTSKAYMSGLTGTPADVKPEKGQSSIGTFSFVLADRNGEITDLVAAGLSGKVVTLYGGFDTIPESDYATFPPCLITGCKLTDDFAGYEFVATDLQQLTNKQVFQVAKSNLTQSISDSGADVYRHYVTITAGISVPGNYIFTNGQDAATFTATLNGVYGAGNWFFYKTTEIQNGTKIYCDTTGMLSAGYVAIDDEIIAYTTKTASYLDGLTRASLGTTIQWHNSGTKVQEVLRIQGHPVDIFIATLTNTDKTGLSISSSNVDLTGLAALKIQIGSSYSMDFRIREAVNGKEWFETELFSVLAAYLVIKGTKISARQFARPVTADSSLTHENIRRTGEDRLALTWDENFESIINSVTFYYDYNAQKNEYTATSTKYTNAASIALYGEYPLVIYSKGYRSTESGTTTLQAAIAALILDRYANGGAPRVTASVFLQKHLIEPGDIVSIDSDILPNKTTGTRGVTGALFEVISRSNLFAEGTTELEMLWTSWNL